MGVSRIFLLIIFYFFLNCTLKATVSFDDIKYWVGSGNNRAALVINWMDGQDALIWGYRWNDSDNSTGEDMLLAIAGADARLNLDYTTYVRGLGYDRNPDPDSTESYDFSDPWTGVYWSYYLNSPQTAGDFTSSTHGTPSGSPYGGGGSWYFSNTGAKDRPLQDGAWDAWLWQLADDSSNLDNEPIAAEIPEIKHFILLFYSIIFYVFKRKK